MRNERDTRAEQQGDGQPENQRELDDRTSGAALSGAALSGPPRPPAGEAAQAAAHHPGTPDRITRRAVRSSELEQDL